MQLKLLKSSTTFLLLGLLFLQTTNKVFAGGCEPAPLLLVSEFLSWYPNCLALESSCGTLSVKNNCSHPVILGTQTLLPGERNREKVKTTEVGDWDVFAKYPWKVAGEYKGKNIYISGDIYTATYKIYDDPIQFKFKLYSITRRTVAAVIIPVATIWCLCYLYVRKRRVHSQPDK